MKKIFSTFLYFSICFLLCFPKISLPEPLFSGFDQFMFIVLSLLFLMASVLTSVPVFNSIDAFIGIFFIYSLARAFDFDIYEFSHYQTTFLAPIFFYWLVRLSKQPYFDGKGILKSIVAITVFQTTYGFFQLFGLLESNNHNFKITGSLNNPGPYAILLAAVFLFCVFYYTPNRQIKKLYKLSLLLPLIIIILSFSRTAYISIIASFLLTLNILKGTILGRRNQLKFSSVIVIGLCVLSVGFIFLLFQKFESIQGRLLIYWINISLIGKHWFVGAGSDYLYQVSQEQALILTKDCFRSLTDNAGESYYTFNEYLGYLVEGGILKLTLFFIPLLLLLRAAIRFIKTNIASDTTGSNNVEFIYSVLGLLLMILSSGFFSYSFHVLQISILFWSLLGLLVNLVTPSKAIDSVSPVTRGPLINKMFTSILASGLALFMLYKTYNTLSSLLKFKHLNENFFYMDDETYHAKLVELYGDLHYNFQYLFILGNSYKASGDYISAVRTLNRTKKIIPVKETYYTVGMLYEKLNNSALAEQEYSFVSRKIPYLIRPKYLLAKLYFKTNQKKKFIAEAKRILTMKPKIKSNSTDFMVKDIRNMLKTYNN